MKNPEEKIPTASFENLIVEFHHRLLSLEADLKAYGRAGGITARSFNRRIRKVQNVHKELTRLHKVCYTESMNQQKSDFGLPSLDCCTPSERSVIESYLDERDTHLKRVESLLAQVLKWVQLAAKRKAGFFRLTFNLSKIRKHTALLEERRVVLKEESQAQSLQIEKLLQKFKRGVKGDLGRNAIEGLAAIFTQLDATISRVARLRGKARKLRTQLTQMATWLEQRETQLRHGAHPQPLPPPEATARLTAQLRRDLHKQYLESRKKQSLIEQFWKSVVSQPSSDYSPREDLHS
jgi:hypothetical protein